MLNKAGKLLIWNSEKHQDKIWKDKYDKIGI